MVMFVSLQNTIGQLFFPIIIEVLNLLILHIHKYIQSSSLKWYVCWTYQVTGYQTAIGHPLIYSPTHELATLA